MISDQKLAELRDNFDAFKRALSALERAHADKYVLIRHGAFIGYFDTAHDALLSGRENYDDGLYSVQEITRAEADLGWYSRAPAYTEI